MSAKKILVCDDDPGILELLELLLEDEGYVVIGELNSLNVDQLIQTQNPDLVLLDLWMPLLSGDQVLHSIRQNPKSTDLPVMIISASKDGKDIAKNAGANDYLPKPFDIDLLLNKVDGLLKQAV
jgi:DNA-binding response OmpR family regulator